MNGSWSAICNFVEVSDSQKDRFSDFLAVVSTKVQPGRRFLRTRCVETVPGPTVTHVTAHYCSDEPTADESTNHMLQPSRRPERLCC